ncbi:MAG: helix-turn-helix domain-containing protein [Myxococcota bacterium]
MVGQRSPTLYELLEVSSGATFEEIEQSYQRIASYLGADSLAVYSILDSDDAHSARAQIDEAYRTLSDPDRRAAYDRSRKEASYPSMMVPAASGGSTSTADADIASRDRFSEPSERDKRLPVTGRSQSRQPIRGPGARTGRTPLYGRDVGRSSKANEPAAAEPKKKPLYGRAQPRGAGASEAPPEPKGRHGEPDRGSARWSTRDGDQDQHEDAPQPSLTRQASGDGPLHRDEVVDAPQRYAVAPRDDKRAESPTRQDPGRADAAPRKEPKSSEERPELVKTASDVVEPRKRPTLPPPSQLSASAKAKKRILSPSIAMELTGDVEYGGSLLRRLRESTGASLDEVAEITKVGKRHLIAIETNDFAALPAAVYTRGFVAEYARVLGLDVSRVTKSFMALYAKYRGVGG